MSNFAAIRAKLQTLDAGKAALLGVKSQGPNLVKKLRKVVRNVSALFPMNIHSVEFALFLFLFGSLVVPIELSPKDLVPFPSWKSFPRQSIHSAAI